MKKIIIYLIAFNFSIIITSYAKPYNAYDIEKSIGLTMKECNISNEITSYDYTKLSEKQRLDDALNYLINHVNNFNIDIDYGNASVTPKCSRFYYEFYDYLFKSLMSIKDNSIKNSNKYNAALFYYYFNEKNKFYELEKLTFYAKKLSNISNNEFINIFPVKDDDSKKYILEYINNLYKVIKFLNDSKNITNNSNAGVFYNKLVDASLDDFALLETGKADIFNSGIDLFYKSETQGSGLYKAIAVDFSELDTKKLNKYLLNNFNTFKNNPKDINEYVEYISSGFDYNLSVFAYNGNIYVMDKNPLNKKMYNMYLYTFNTFYVNNDRPLLPDNLNDPNLFLISGSSKTNNFPLGDIRYLDTEKVTKLFERDVIKQADSSSFIKNGKYMLELASKYYLDYASSVPGQWIYVPRDYYLFDINNDGKDELLGVIAVSSSSYEYEGTFTYILNNKTLKIEDNVLNKFLKTFTGNEDNMADSGYVDLFKNENINNKVNKNNIGTGTKKHFSQILYTHNGKNKILLYEPFVTGIYIDILYEKNKLNITADSIYKYESSITMVWKGKLNNGRPVDLVKFKGITK